MSWMLCVDCGLPIDTDEHPEAFVETKDEKGLPDWICLCEDCKLERELEECDAEPFEE